MTTQKPTADETLEKWNIEADAGHPVQMTYPMAKRMLILIKQVKLMREALETTLRSEGVGEYDSQNNLISYKSSDDLIREALASLNAAISGGGE